MNRLFQQLNRSQNPTANMSGLKNMMKSIQAASNPKQALQSVIQQNPQMKQVMDLVQKSGGDPREAFYALAREKGVDPEEVLKSLK